MKKPAPQKRKYRVFLLEADAVARRWLARLIDAEPDLWVCGAAAGVAGALEQIPAARPEALVLDVDPLDGASVIAINHLRWKHPDLPLVIISLREESVQGNRMLQAGAAGFVTKAEAARQVVPAIRRVLKGGIYVGREHDGKRGGRRKP